MNLFERVKNIWKLSEVHTEEQMDWFETPRPTVSITAHPQPAKFVPRITRDPIKAITQETA